MQQYKFLKNCKNNKEYLDSFFKLTEKMFSLNLKAWHDDGWWKDDYITYSYAENDKIIANASANRTDFICTNGVKHYIQIGTVMTHPEYRNQGLASKLIEKIFIDFPKVDGFYLFANKNAINFYPKFGFKQLPEYLYSQSTVDSKGLACEKYEENKHAELLKNVLIHRKTFCAFQMQGNIGLSMFHVSAMKDVLYFIPQLNVFFAGKTAGSSFFLYDIFSSNAVSEKDLAAYLPKSVRKIRYGYTPLNSMHCRRILKTDADDVLFIKGDFDEFQENKFCFPLFTHA